MRPAFLRRPLYFLLAAGLCAAPARAQSAASLSPRNANYTIDARLDVASRTLTASEVITWRNMSSRPATELRFHLYWNAWRDDRSTFVREARLSPRANISGVQADDWSHIDVTSLRLLGPTAPPDLTSAQRFIAPDDGNADDRTVMAVSLPEPVAPGETATIEVKWTSRVPHKFMRTGAIGHYFFIAQWFPKIGVLQDEGWNCHQFHRSTEFFADYGVYDVSLTVPQGWVTGATGVERERRDNPDHTSTVRYYQADVHDFAWTTSPDFLVRTARFEHPTLPPVEMRLLLQPEHASQADRHFDATRATLKYYGEWYGPYPYGHITIVDPAWQSDSDGMEYPTLFTAGTRWLVAPHVTVPDDVTVHEAGHQFWYGMVGNNEFEDAWMDEGINEFSNARVLAEAYAPSYYSRRYFGGFVPFVFKDIVIPREVQDLWPQYRLGAKGDAQSTPSYLYFPTTSTPITYAKTALWLNTMERWLGWPTLQRVMSTFFTQWKFRHPKPRDFFDTAREVTGRDLGWYFDQVYRSSNVFDYGVADLQTRSTGSLFHTTVVVRRYGEATFPVAVQTTFTDGSQVTEQWAGRDRWKVYQYDRSAAAIRAAVDPDRVLLLDVNVTNNSRTLEPKASAAATKWSTRWMIWLQDALLSWAMFV